MDMDLKGFGPFEIKDAAKGEVEAVVNTLGIVDRDRDVIQSGAIKSGTTVKMSSYGHDVVTDGAPQAGKGTVTEEDGKLLFRGHFFMSTTRGREAFETVKALGPDGEWSIGFNGVKTGELTDEWKERGARRIITSLQLLEVSPVFVGSNPKTGTLAVKSSVAPDCLIVKWGDRTLNVPYTVDDGAVVLLGEAVEVVAVGSDPKAAEPEGPDPDQDVLSGVFLATQLADATTRGDVAREEASRLADAVAAKRRKDDETQRALNEEFDRMQRTARRLGAA